MRYAEKYDAVLKDVLHRKNNKEISTSNLVEIAEFNLKFN